MKLWPLVAVALVTAAIMVAGWTWQRRTRNAGVVDVLWALSMAGSALFYGVVAQGSGTARALVAVLGGIWGLRLALHLAHRVLHEPEDGRYRYLREYWRDDQRKFFAFFMAQALFTAIFSLPFLVAASNPLDAWSGQIFAALLIWSISLGGEAIADRQLAAWRANPAHRGMTCRSGLWRYSRHPNYFFECLHWFAYVLLALGSPWSWLSLLGPALMLISLYWITGIPYVEAQALRSRGDDYREYQRTTSVLIPWRPRH